MEKGVCQGAWKKKEDLCPRSQNARGGWGVGYETKSNRRLKKTEGGKERRRGGCRKGKRGEGKGGGWGKKKLRKLSQRVWANNRMLKGAGRGGLNTVRTSKPDGGWRANWGQTQKRGKKH